MSAADDRYRPMLGYWERPEASAEALAGGELHTGDVGFLDDDGFLHLRDRKSLVIIRGGANVYRMHAVWRCADCGFKTDCCGW